VVSAVELDDWGHRVLRRSLRAVWLLWSLLLVLHVGFWSTHFPIHVTALLPVVLLIAARSIHREVHVWCAAAGTLVLVGVALPAHFSVCALLTAAALGVRALRQPHAMPPAAPEASASPYRALDESLPPIAAVRSGSFFAPPTTAARRRLLTGALFAVYLAVWTLGWTGGPWPAHLVSLDLLVTAAVLLVVLRMRVRIALAPLLASYTHLAVQTGLVSAPTSVLAWGATTVGLGFALLIASLAASYWLRNVETDRSG
jgi:hypothetical protein